MPANCLQNCLDQADPVCRGGGKLIACFFRHLRRFRKIYGKTGATTLAALLCLLVLAACTYRDSLHSAFFEAEDCLSRGWYQKALDLYSKVLKSDPNFASAHFGMGRTLDRLGKYPEAAAELQSAIRIDARNASYKRELGDIYCDQKLYEKAIEVYDQAINLKSDLPDLHTKRAAAYLHLDKFDRTVEDCDKSLRLHPENVFDYQLRGCAYLGKKEYRSALEDFDEALRIDPKSLDNLCNRGTALSLLKEYQRALADFRACLAVDPKYERALLAVGSTYILMGDYKNAICSFGDAIKILPRSPLAYVNRGNAYFASEKYDAALADYDTAMRLAPQDPAPCLHRAVSKLAMQRALSASGDFEQYLEKSQWKSSDMGLAASFCSIAYKIAGQGANADLVLSRAETHCLPDHWGCRLVYFLHGKMPGKSFFDQLSRRSKDESTWTYCALGLNALADHDKISARKYFRWVIENGNTADQTWKLARIYSAKSN